MAMSHIRIRKIEYLVECNARKGNTTFLLMAAVDNPNVAIIFAHKELAEHSKIRYKELYNKRYNLLVKWYHKNIQKRKMPLFLSIHQEVGSVLKVPIVFDNSCLG